MLLDPRVSACIVMYKSGEKTLDAIDSVLGSDIPVDLHLVDNSPQEVSSRMVHAARPEVPCYAQEKNLGYGGGNNVVLPFLRSEYHIIMNPDITFDPDLVSRMVSFMDAHRDIDLLTPRVLYPSGQEQYVPRRQPTVRYLLSREFSERSPYFRKLRDEYTMAGLDITGPVQVQFATGCFMMIRTHLFYQLKGFDTRFFLYHEDSDLSRRVMKHGKIVYHPDFVVTHSWTRSSASDRDAFRQHVKSSVRFFRKWGWYW